ncbi:hypothetical protein CBR_g12336 [Chara braunii]|uniref:Uncharacterized protein n=1 Tax=Chara braunii TaxID=69332 RepID=A0A388KRZ4_CHABU|nr:hypothetical protein CBR_g12336 [Chara braunii]|eukprot:GBG72768.1 hypothetical protein CBR_g12336 [Chara braunii]
MVPGLGLWDKQGRRFRLRGKHGPWLWALGTDDPWVWLWDNRVPGFGFSGQDRPWVWALGQDDPGAS